MTLIEAVRFAFSIAAIKGIPSARYTANEPQKESPAPLVSIASTGTRGYDEQLPLA